jgi:hypothetical protein
MTYRSKGEPRDEIIYYLARYIYANPKERTSKFSSWAECFRHHAGCTLQEYMEYAKENNLKEKYIHERKRQSRS